MLWGEYWLDVHLMMIDKPYYVPPEKNPIPGVKTPKNTVASASGEDTKAKALTDFLNSID